MRMRGSVAVFLVLTASMLACVSGTTAPPTGRQDPGAESTVILISFDGFRWDYVDWDEAATIRGLAENGVRAEGLIPVFPSKTFPCHYSIVTGLYPGHNGIVSNHMYDADIGGEFHLSDPVTKFVPEFDDIALQVGELDVPPGHQITDVLHPRRDDPEIGQGSE